MGSAWSMELLCVPKVLHGEKEGGSILSVSRRGIMRHSNAQATSAPRLEPLVHIRRESGNNVVELERDAGVAQEVEGVPDGAFRWS